MNPFLAAGIFDQPWLVAVLVVAGAIINWLTQRRQAKQEREAEARGDDEAPAPPEKPGQVPDIEEALRRLLGEETARPKPAPPPLPPTTRPLPSLPPARTGGGKPPGLVSSPVAVVLPVVTGAVQEQAALRLAQVDQQVQRPIVSLPRQRRSSGGWNSLWRNRPNARRAFVASLVFGTPKGLEPRAGSSPALTSWH